MMNKGRGSDLADRTKRFALAVIHLYSKLPKSTEAQVIGRQVVRSGMSVGAQYREAIRAKSVADFINKVEGSLQELEETQYWFELLDEAGIAADEVELFGERSRRIDRNPCFQRPNREAE